LELHKERAMMWSFLILVFFQQLFFTDSTQLRSSSSSTSASSSSSSSSSLFLHKKITEPSKHMLDSKDATSSTYFTSQGQKSTGIPVGDKNQYPHGADCYNVNNIIMKGRKDETQGPITYRQAWNEEVSTPPPLPPQHLKSSPL
jgi:hypothetical protein